MLLPTSQLKENYLFASLDEAQQKEIESHARRRRLDAGEQLFSQGDKANLFWWLEKGRIKLYRLSRDGDQKIMGVVDPRQSFAEGILFMENPRYPVNAEAIMETEAIGFERGTYLDILETSFDTCRGLFRQMVRRTQRHLDEIEALTIQNARYRLVNYLLRLHSAAGKSASTFKLPVAKQLIASQLAVRPETLSRLFRELEQDNLIRVKGNTIYILDRTALENLP